METNRLIIENDVDLFSGENCVHRLWEMTDLHHIRAALPLSLLSLEALETHLSADICVNLCKGSMVIRASKELDHQRM